MLRALLLILLTGFSINAMALDLPSFFQPSSNDLSIWYLGNIFGSDLIEGNNIPDIMLLSRLFGIFNQVALAVGMIVVVYTVFAGTLNTASEGKPLGEKWNSVWMPVRISAGIGLLVPKGGSGYCLAQYIVMWLTVQGIGAADTVWKTMIDYFAQGGAIYSKRVNDDAVILNFDNMDYTYALQAGVKINGRSSPTAQKAQQEVGLVKSTVCMQLFNTDEGAQSLSTSGNDRYTMYIAPDRNDLLLFGDRKKYDPNKPIDSPDQAGGECGYVWLSSPTDQRSQNSEAQNVARIYTLALYNMAKGLDPLAKYIVAGKGDGKDFDRYYNDARRSMEMYINYISGYQGLLAPKVDTRGHEAAFKEMISYGWILAGNYYTFLANLSEKENMIQTQFIKPQDARYPYPGGFVYKAPLNGGKEEMLPYYNAVTAFYSTNYFLNGSNNYEDMYAIPRSEYYTSQNPPKNTTGITRSKVVDLANRIKTSKSVGSGEAGKETKKRVDEFIKNLSGTSSAGSLSSPDPIVRAAKFGRDLTLAGAAMIVTFATALPLLAFFSSMGAAYSGKFSAFLGPVLSVIAPGLVAMATIMYTEGVMLGIFLPLIPFITFLTGVIGWLMQVVESIAAAPLVAIGLIFPESKDEIWGRAAPAYMLVLNLFLRPSLMIIGFAAAMMVTWISVELLNIGFLTLMYTSFFIEDMFGFLTIVAAYIGVMITVVTKTYSLINVVPNKVLHWIGDQSMAVQGAEEAIGGAKQASEKGGGVASGGLAGAQKADMWRADTMKRQSDDAKRAKQMEGGGETPTTTNTSKKKEPGRPDQGADV